MLGTYKIKVRELAPTDPSSMDGGLNYENVMVTAKNTDTLEEYSKREYVHPDYIPKIQYWLEKRKYDCEETSPFSLHLSIDNLFDFNLDKT